MPAGDAILYPSGALHRVQTVAAGTRVVAVTWMQSRVTHAHHRGVLHDFDLARTTPDERDRTTPKARLDARVYDELMRMWAKG